MSTQIRMKIVMEARIPNTSQVAWMEIEVDPIKVFGQQGNQHLILIAEILKHRITEKIQEWEGPTNPKHLIE